MIIVWRDCETIQDCEGSVCDKIVEYFDYGMERDRVKPIRVKLTAEEAERLCVECHGACPKQIDGIPIVVIESKRKGKVHVETRRGKAGRRQIPSR